MPWKESDDDELEACFDRLLRKQKELQAQLRPIEILINNIREIQTRKVTSYTDTREQKITEIKPKDKWGQGMSDRYRLVTKEECTVKTNELLGTEEVQDE